VTARKRDESLVNVPEPITAFSTKQIEQAGLRSLRDFTDLTPNITFTTGAGASYPNIMVRGLAQAQNGEPPIAVVIDGVQVADPSLLPQDFADVAQVEVLRGPQGSLYGRNAIGGAINITTRQPTNDFEGRLKASYGNASSSDISADFSGPIVPDKVLFRVGGGYQRTDGQVQDLATGRPADFGRNEFVRGRLIFNLSDALTLDVRGHYGYDRIGIPTAEIVPNSAFDDYDLNFLESDPSIVETRKLYDLAAKLEYKGEGFTITSVSGYSHVNDLFYGDGDFTPAHVILQDVVLRVRAFTQELRIASSSEDRLRWLFGGFYQDRHTDNFQDFLLDDGTGNPIPGAAASLSHDVGSSKSWAPFGSVSYDVLRQLELTVGARYDQDKRTSVDSFTLGSAVEKTFSSFQPKVQLSYKPTPNLNLYTTYGKGFSSGGFNPASSAVARLFKAQTADNFEIGVKGSTANGLLTYSLAAFRVYYHDQQFYYVVIAPASQNVVNIDKTRADGAEFELTAHPTKQLSISTGLGLTDAKILRFAANPAFVGNRTPQSEKYTVNVTGQYTVPLGDALDLRAYASYRRQGSEFWDSANTVSTGPKGFVNLRLFLEGRAGWSIGGFVQNLTDSQYPTIAIANVAPGYSVRLQSRHRTYGVEASYKF
jgi:iron complex outermembrane recepter protein